jgi:8-oxo-dGTP pyrophosphatase MutT (NUDIX family)
MGEQSLSVPLHAAHFADLARRKLHADATSVMFEPGTGRPNGPSDFDLNPDMMSEIDAHIVPRAAAVMVPIVAHAEPTMLLTRRAEHLPSHPGQVAFPGGKVEAFDADALAAAIREAEEEIGLAARFVEPLGYLDGYRTRTHFQITPAVCLVEPGFELTLDPSEVDAAFEVPLAFLMDPANHQTHSRKWKGKRRSFYAMPYDEHYIWGATAGMIKNLFEKLTQP